jgi:hypothetical protein
MTTINQSVEGCLRHFLADRHKFLLPPSSSCGQHTSALSHQKPILYYTPRSPTDDTYFMSQEVECKWACHAHSCRLGHGRLTDPHGRGITCKTAPTTKTVLIKTCCLQRPATRSNPGCPMRGKPCRGLKCESRHSKADQWENTRQIALKRDGTKNKNKAMSGVLSWSLQYALQRCLLLGLQAADEVCDHLRTATTGCLML